ncbi:MAG: GHKL domain-containing protein [bacterium]|nr:GHKL domain-containing protein [bacterium]
MLKLLFKDTWYKTICVDGIIILYAFILDPILSIIMSFTFTNVIELNIQAIPKLLISIIFSYIYYFTFYHTKVKILVQYIIETLLKSKKTLIYLYVSILIVNTFNILYGLNYLDYKYYVTIILMIMYMVYFATMFSKEIYNNKMLVVKNKYLNEYLENYEKISDNYRTLKHNLRNDLYLIKCSKEKDPVINKMYEKYTDDENWEGKISGIPSVLQGIIFLKMQYAETKNIKFMVDNKIDENELDENSQIYLDTCEIVAICLDNAIEASEETDKKLISMDINHQESYYIIEITNTFKNKLDIDRLGEKNYSTKNRNSGIGLNYIENLSKSITVKRLIIENIFRTIIKVEKEEKTVRHK